MEIGTAATFWEQASRGGLLPGGAMGHSGAMRSLGSRLVVAWVLSLMAALAVGAVLVQLYRLSSAAQAGLRTAELEQGCALLAETYGFYVAGWAGPGQARELEGFRRELQGVVGMALAGRPGLEAGIWQAERAGETLAGDPGTLRAALAQAAATALREDEVTEFEGGGRLGLACPLGGPVAGLVGWVAQRTAGTPGLRELQVGMAVLLALVLLLAGWLSLGLVALRRRARAIEAGLSGHERAGADSTLPHVPPTGERELDRIVAALNAAGDRLAEARAREAALAARMAQGERLAALGRVAAGVAHEIRNPIAAMRLRAENALAGDPARRGAALEAILAQVARLDRLSGELLAMTQKREPVLAPTQLDALLAAVAGEQEQGEVHIAVQAPALSAMLDEGLVRRVLDALLENALRHTPPGGTVTLSAAREGEVLRIAVADTGPGVPPELRAWLFEPFVTGRPEGTGLGLAIARELADAMGGRLFLAETGPGATFVLELPWRAC